MQLAFHAYHLRSDSVADWLEHSPSNAESNGYCVMSMSENCSAPTNVVSGRPAYSHAGNLRSVSFPHNCQPPLIEAWSLYNGI